MHNPVRVVLHVVAPVHNVLNEVRSNALQAGIYQIITFIVQNGVSQDPGTSI